jgi:hypothetical protein
MPSPEAVPTWWWWCVPAVGVVQPADATPLFLLSHVPMTSQHAEVINGRSGNIYETYALVFDVESKTRYNTCGAA